LSAYGQTRVVKGTVVDESNEPVIGATITTNEDKTIGTITDASGGFTLNIPQNSKNLSVAFLGLQTQKVSLTNAENYHIILRENTVLMDDVVVVGYGYQKKSDLTGAVASVKTESITGRMVSIEQGLQGRVSGVQITQSEASPDGGLSMVIRGSNSIVGGTEPLYVVDGIPISGGNSMIKGPTDSFGATGSEQTMTQPANMLSFLNPADIESIEILKDASSTAIYGSRAANGVVLITTKKGSEGSTKVTFDASVDFANAYRKWDLLDAGDYAEQRRQRHLISKIVGQNMTYEEAITDMPFSGAYNGQYNTKWNPSDNFGGDGVYRPTPDDFRSGRVSSTDWQDAILRTGVNQKYSITVSGGTKDLRYYVGAGMDNVEGILVGSKFKRYSVNSNIDSRFWNRIQFTNSFNASYTKSNRAQVGNIQSGDSRGVMMAAVVYDPTKTITGNRYEIENGLLINSDDPYTAATGCLDINTVYTVLDNMSFTIDILEGLKFKISGGVHYTHNIRDIYNPRTSNRYWDASGQGYAFYGNNDNFFVINENILMYNKKFNKHTIDALAGFTQETSKGNGHSMSGKGFLNDYNTYHVLGSATTFYTPYSDYWKTSGKSYLGRINYNYDDRYLLTVSFRADGSSKFGKNNKWGYFPSGAFAWRIDQEKFMKKFDFLSNLKLRLSVGATGNQGVGAYQSLSALIPGVYPVEGKLGPTYQLGNTMANPDLKWEKTVQYDAGLDIGLFNNRLTLTADVYRKNTTDLLQGMTLASNTGYNTIFKNAGSLRNTGVELSLTGIISDSDFFWSMTGNWSTNKIKVTSLGGLESYPGMHVWGWANYPFPITVGRPLGEIWGYKITNVMKTWEQRENAAKDNPNMIEDTNPVTGERQRVGKLGEYDFEKDENGMMKKQIIGNTNPDFIFGVNSMMRYKNFELSFAIAGSIGQDILNLQAMPGFDYSLRVHDYADDRWVPEVKDRNGKIIYEDNGKSGNILENPWGANYGEGTYSKQVENGSWVKLKNVTLAYTHRFKKKPIHISSIRPYAAFNNILCIDSYSGLDPEASVHGQDPTRRGVAFSEYPMSFSMTFGVNITF